MTFANLSEATKLIYMTNFELFGKAFLLFIMFAISIYYLSYGRYQKQLEYMLSDRVEMVKIAFCKIFLFSFPLWIFILYPSASFSYMLNGMLAIYSFVIPAILVGFTIGILIYGTPWLLRVIGIDVTLERDKQIMTALDKQVPKAKGFTPSIVKKIK